MCKWLFWRCRASRFDPITEIAVVAALLALIAPTTPSIHPSLAVFGDR